MYAIQLTLKNLGGDVPPSPEGVSEAIARSALALCGDSQPIEYSRLVRLGAHTVAVLFLVANSEAEALLLAELIGKTAAQALGLGFGGVQTWVPGAPRSPGAADPADPADPGH